MDDDTRMNLLKISVVMGADVNRKYDKDGKTPLELAKEHERLVMFVADHSSSSCCPFAYLLDY